jgi:hypothetical protein
MERPEKKEFVEPVVLVDVPFNIVREVAQETVVRTHALVMRLTRDATSAPSGEESVHAAVPSR